MAKIEVDIVVPSKFLPPADLDFDRWEQYLTYRLVEYFPRLIEELLDDHPYLEDLDIERKDIEAKYRADDKQVRGGWWITVVIDKIPPTSERTATDLQSALQITTARWFLLKNYEGVFLSLVVKWADT